MKKYRLLKDSSIFKAGDIFKLEGGNLYYYPAENGTENAHWSDRVMAYHHKTLEKSPNILDEWFEEVEEPEYYWFIRDGGNIDRANIGFSMVERHKELGNYFSSKEEADLAVRKLKAWKRLKDKGFKFCGIDGDYIRFSIDISKVNSTKENKELNKYGELLFGGEE